MTRNKTTGNDTPEALLQVFRTMPGKMLLLAPKIYTVLTATNEYISSVSGPVDLEKKHNIFTLLKTYTSGNASLDYSDLQTSLRRVEALGIQDHMPVQRYAITSKDRKILDKYWMVTNNPIHDQCGNLIYILHRVEDVTALYFEESKSSFGLLTKNIEQIESLMKMQALRAAVSVLEESHIKLKNARTLLNLASWEYNVKSKRIIWSETAKEILNFLPETLTPANLRSYLSSVHHDDRRKVVLDVRNFATNSKKEIRSKHRILKANGSIVSVSFVGQRHQMDGREFIFGFIQDISENIKIQTELYKAQELIQRAGENLKIGGWRLNRDMTKVVWTEGLYKIFGIPLNEVITPERGLEFYKECDRERIIYLVRHCFKNAESFDETFELETSTHTRVTIRVIGWPIFSNSGTVEAIQGAVQDLSSLAAAEQKAYESDTRRLELLESISDGFISLDGSLCFTYLNSRAEEILQCKKIEVLGLKFFEMFPEAKNTHFYKNLIEAKNERRTTQFLEYMIDLDIWLDISIYPASEGLSLYFRDATNEKRNSEALRVLEEAASKMNDGLVILEANLKKPFNAQKIVYANQAIAEMSRQERSKLIGNTALALNNKKIDNFSLEKLDSAIRGVRREVVESTHTRSDGSSYWIEISMSPVLSATGGCTHFICINRDVTEWKNAQKALEYAATRDEITGLFNRTVFSKMLDKSLIDVTLADKTVALFLIDCDNFKSVNDTLGHSVGDALLRKISDRLSQKAPTDSLLARLGGDEFVLMVENLNQESALSLAENIREAILNPFEIGARHVSITASIGIAIAPFDATDTTKLMRSVDIAMYRSKRLGRNSVTKFVPSMELEVFRQAQIMQGLQESLTQSKGFELHFQPIFDLHDNKIVVAEALLRWTHPSLGEISPAEFIPAAEDAGLIRMLDRMVIDMAVTQISKWIKSGLNLSVSVNISPLSLRSEDLSNYIIDCLKNADVPGSCFEIEITESVFLESSDCLRNNLFELRQSNIAISIDDFGTGHSSLSYLQRLPIDKIKIDQSFTGNVSTKTELNGNALMSAILAMAHALHFKVVAEGVETEDQKKWLVNSGCNLLQGFLLGPPRNSDQFLEEYQNYFPNRWDGRTKC